MIQLDKKEARQLGRERRKNLSFEEKQKLDELLFQKAIVALEPYHEIGLFVSMEEEANTIALIDWCLAQGKHVYLPNVVKTTLCFTRYNHEDCLEKSPFGVLEPKVIKPIDLSLLDIMLVPFTAYDHFYHRTGYGKGYYDSVLNQVSYKVGYGYAIQEVECIDVEPHDVTLDDMWVV